MEFKEEGHEIAVGPHGEMMEWGPTTTQAVAALYVDGIGIGLLEEDHFVISFSVECPDHGHEDLGNVAVPMELLDAFVLGLTKMQEFVAAEAATTATE